MTVLRAALLGLLMVLPAVFAAADQSSISMWAIQATSEGREKKEVDPELSAVERILLGLPFDTFEKLEVKEEVKLPFGQETRIRITDTYTLVLKPVNREFDGRVRMELRVELKEPDAKESVNALAAKALMQPGEKIKLQGFKLPSGADLVLVLSLKT